LSAGEESVQPVRMPQVDPGGQRDAGEGDFEQTRGAVESP